MTVRDSIEKVIFVEDAFNGEKAATFSPDGRYFFVITKRGLLRSGELESTIWLFDSAAASRALKRSSGGHTPDVRSFVKMGTLSNGDPITEARWAADSKTIAFLGRNNNNDERHLFVLSVKGGRLKQLSPNGVDVTAFDHAKNKFVFTTVPSVTSSQLYQSGGPTLPNIQIGTGVSLFSLLYPKWERFTFGGRRRELWQVRNDKISPVVDSATSAPISLFGESHPPLLALSPSGRYAVVADRVAHVPPTWESYESRYPFNKIVADKPNTKAAMDYLRPLQYKLIDLKSGRMLVLIDAPLGESGAFVDASMALWSQNEREVILTNTFLPLERKNVASIPESARPWIVAVDIGSGKITRIKEASPDNDEHSRPRLSGLEWQAGPQLVLRYYDYHAETDLEPELFQRENGIWKAVTDRVAIHAAAKASRGRGLAIDVRQSVNEPPVLVATDVETGESKEIWDPNPQFARIKFGEATVYNWHDRAGHDWTGGLVKPPDYVAGHRYPLVIQTHGFNQAEFLTDGAFPTAMAARPMAARGIVVLQVGTTIIGPNVVATPRESAQIRDGYVAAIDQLDTDGLIDPQRVGIIGFSRTGWYVLDCLLHAGKYFVVATLAESTYISFGEYMLNADYGGPGRAESIAAAMGGPPFADGLQKWISDSAGFNTDKIDVPILFEANSPVGIIYAWDVYAAMRLQKKPVELLYFRNGEHILTKPLERLASQEMNVDWYDFWLNDHADPDPTKAEQYARWENLKKLRAESQKALSRSESQ
jgi:dipeptidyl aminopeptidase/acylaminoacyl peptidase